MELSKEEEARLIRLIRSKVVERGGTDQLTEDDKHDIATDFLIERKHGPKDKENGKSVDEILSSHAKDIHTNNVIRINKLIDKLEKGIYTDGFDKLMKSVEIQGLDRDRWDFHLGCKVVVDMSKERFKFLQLKTLGWAKRLKNVLGQYGYVTNVKNEYDNKIVVYFPDVFTSTMLFAGVLSKTDKDFHVVASRWKVGDFVRTKKNKALVKKFQKKLPDLPEKNMGKQGRVIAVTSAGVFVTFNGVSSYSVNPAILQEVEDPAPIVSKTITDHPRGFYVGLDVMVIRDFKKLIENQKEFGGWNWKMSSIAGKTVTIVHIKLDGSLIVRMKVGRTWRLNYESAYLSGSDSFPGSFATNDVPFIPGDLVRLRISNSIKIQLVAAKVLESCLDFLKLPGKVEGIDDDFDVVVRFSDGKKQILSPRLLQKLPSSKFARFYLQEDRNLSLNAGDMVRVYAGPPRYVEEILSKMKIKTSTYKTLTEEAELMGYVDYEHAVIRYEDAQTIKINKQYLVLAQQSVYDTPEKIDFDQLKILVQTVENCIAVSNVQKDCCELNGSVDIFSVTTGSPPTVSLRINSPKAEPEDVINGLSTITTWNISRTCENECTIVLDGGVEIDIVLLTQDEIKAGEEMKELSVPDIEKPEVIEGSESDAPKQKENPKVAPTTRVFSESVGEIQVTDVGQGASAVQGYQAFRYMSIRIGNGSVQIPFVPLNDRPGPATSGGRSGNGNTNIIIQGDYGRVGFNSNN